MNGPVFGEFKGLRYRDADLTAVTAPPYDVINHEERVLLADRSSNNIVHVDLPVATNGDDPYLSASRRFQHWMATGVLAEDESEAMYGYEMSTPAGLTIRGVIGELGLDQIQRTALRPHELTTPKARHDRLRLLAACRVDLSPIWVLSPGLDALTIPLGEDPLEVVTDFVTHRMWRIPISTETRALATAIGGEPAIVADGHHRLSVAIAHADHTRTARPAAMALATGVETAARSIQPIHRIVRFADQVADPESVVRAVAGSLEPASTSSDALRVVVGGDTFAVRDMTGGPDTLAVSWLLRELPPAEVEFEHRLSVAVEAASQPNTVTFLCRPATARHLRQAIDLSELMPPKTTLFWPKPLTGMVFRRLGDA